MARKQLSDGLRAAWSADVVRLWEHDRAASVPEGVWRSLGPGCLMLGGEVGAAGKAGRAVWWATAAGPRRRLADTWADFRRSVRVALAARGLVSAVDDRRRAQAAAALRVVSAVGAVVVGVVATPAAGAALLAGGQALASAVASGEGVTLGEAAALVADVAQQAGVDVDAEVDKAVEAVAGSLEVDPSTLGAVVDAAGALGAGIRIGGRRLEPRQAQRLGQLVGLVQARGGAAIRAALVQRGADPATATRIVEALHRLAGAAVRRG